MQRRIVAGVIAMILMLGGVGFALWTYKQNRPYPLWIAMPVNPELPSEKRDEIVKELKARLQEKELLTKVAKELSLVTEWKLSSEDQAVDELRRRMVVNSSEGNLGKQIPPAINVGVTGKRKEKELSGKLANRLMKDVFKILGIEEPSK